MKYKTTIEIVSEAENKAEALEIVGEYLSGNIVSGIDMKCATKRVLPYKKIIVSVVALTILLSIGILSTAQVKSGKPFIAGISSLDAVQLPLKTQAVKDKETGFKKAWNAKQVSEALNRIKNQ